MFFFYFSRSQLQLFGIITHRSKYFALQLFSDNGWSTRLVLIWRRRILRPPLVAFNICGKSYVKPLLTWIHDRSPYWYFTDGVSSIIWSRSLRFVTSAGQDIQFINPPIHQTENEVWPFCFMELQTVLCCLIHSLPLIAISRIIF